MISHPTETEAYLCPEMAGTLMTPEEFDAVEEYDDDYSYELIHGVLIVNPVPLAQETGPNEELGRLLLNHRANHPQGKLLDFTLPEQYIRTHDGRRRADRVIWTGLGRMPIVKRDIPSIAVEFVSSGKRNRYRDYVEKKGEYMALGISEYWIIDRFRRIMTVYRNQPGEIAEITIKESEAYESPLLPGFEVQLQPLLRLADQLVQPD